MVRSLLVLALASAVFGATQGSRSLLQAPVPAPGPDYAPAPTTDVNGEPAYTCPTPGSTGYLFQTAPCNFGDFAGLAVYCDQSTEGDGFVGIRSESSGNCTASSDCAYGEFCSAQMMYNNTCTPVADTLCFAGALPPVPAPAPVLAPAGAPAAAPLLPFITSPLAPTTSAAAPVASSGDGEESDGEVVAPPTAGS